MWGSISLWLWFAFLWWLAVLNILSCVCWPYIRLLWKRPIFCFFFLLKNLFLLWYSNSSRIPSGHTLLAKSSGKVAAYRILGSLIHRETSTTSWESGDVLTMSVAEKQMTPKILKATSHKTLYILFLVPKHHTNLQYTVKEESSNLSMSRALSSLIFWPDYSFLI